jgi:RNA polymerase sigma factor (sigma-70 family)
MEKSPLQLIGGCAKQDTTCKKLLFEEYYAILMKVAFRYVSTYEQALEATHNGFLRIFRECPRFRSNRKVKGKDALSVWIKRVFIITIVDHVKAEPDLYTSRHIPDDLWLSYTQLPSDIEMMYIELIKILKELPVSSRLVFNLHIIDGFSHREIARILDITVKDSKHRVVDAREYCNRSLTR